MTEERVLKARLEFFIDNRGLQKLVQDTKRAGDQAAKAQGGTTDEVRKTQAAAQRAQAQFEAFRKEVEKGKSEMNALKESADRVAFVSTSIAATGAAITAPLLLMARNYAQTSGLAEETSRNWAKAATSLDQSQTRIGRVAAQSIVPVMELASRVAEQAAGFAEKHPGVVQFAMTAGTAIAAVGALGLAISQGVKFYADVKTLALIATAGATQMTAAKVMDAASNKQLAAAGIMGKTSVAGLMTKGAGALAGAGLTAGAIGTGAAIAGTALGGVALGFAGNELLANTALGKQLGLQKFGKWATAGAYKFGTALDSLTGQDTDVKSKRFALLVAKWTGAIDEAGLAAADSALKVQEFAASAKEADENIKPDMASIQQYAAYLQAQEQAEEQHQEQRTNLVEQYSKRRAEIEKTYEEQRTSYVEDYSRMQAERLEEFNYSVAKQAEDFAKSQADADQQYYKSRADAQQDYAQESQRAEEDHKRRLLEIQASHEDRLEGLVANRDALGIVAENRAYDREVQAEKESFDLQKQRRAEDFKQQLADMAANHAEQREAAQKAYDEQLADQQEAFDRQTQKQQEAYDEQLAEMEDAQAEQLQALETAKEDELQALDDAYEKERKLREQTLADQYRMMSESLLTQSNTMSEWWQNMTDGWRGFVSNISNISSALPGYTESAGSSSSGDPAAGQSKKGRASGGYAGFGSYNLGEAGEEFVMSNATTRAAEQMLGQRLNQESILKALLTGRGGGRGSITSTANIHLAAGSITAQQRREMLNESRIEALQAMSDAFDMSL